MFKMRNRKRKYSCLMAWLKSDKEKQRRIDNLYSNPGYHKSINTNGYSFNEY